MLGLTYKTAWFMAHRIREAMKDENPSPMGGPGGSVQADETYFGKVEDTKTETTSGREFTGSRAGRGPANKRAVVSLISGGKARTFHVDRADSVTVRQILVTNVRRETELYTDESRIYVKVGEDFSAHKTVNHSANEYVGPSGQSTNKVENYFSIFKRGMKGVYQHCAEKHLQRYINEFDFRYNNRELTDSGRRDKALSSIEGKRLTYRRIGNGANV
jgi:transposase-like protein